MKLLIKGGRVINPGKNFDAVSDVLIENGKIAVIGEDLNDDDDTQVIDAAGKIVAPGFIDMHTHLREPGQDNHLIRKMQKGLLSFHTLRHLSFLVILRLIILGRHPAERFQVAFQLEAPGQVVHRQDDTAVRIPSLKQGGEQIVLKIVELEHQTTALRHPDMPGQEVEGAPLAAFVLSAGRP